MVEYQVQNGGLGLDEMIAVLVNATWKAGRKKGMEGLIQLQTEQLLLTYLLAASANESNSFITRSVLQKALSDLKIFIESKKRVAADGFVSWPFAAGIGKNEETGECKTDIACGDAARCADRVWE
jgi:hypothetical protein